MNSRSEHQNKLKELDEQIQTIDRMEANGTLTLYGIKYRTALKAEAEELRNSLQTH